MLSEAAAVLDVVDLRDAKIVRSRNLLCCRTRNGQQAVHSTDLIRIEADALTNTTSLNAAAKTKVNSDHAIRMTRDHHCRCNDLASVQRNLHRVRLIELQV